MKIKGICFPFLVKMTKILLCLFYLTFYVRIIKEEGDGLAFWGNLLQFLDADMKEPQMYRWFHLLFFALSIIGGILLCRFCKGDAEKSVRKWLLITAIISLVLEVYKQINFTFSYDGTVITGDYEWYAFPFQFCSTPMYISLLATVVTNKKLHTALCAYLATFAFFAGLCVMFYPTQVFISTIGINIQTMICHGIMISIGIYLLGSEYVKLEHKTILKAIPTFAICLFIASAINEVAYFSGLLERESFNMFYISPHCEPSLPVYSLVQQVVPFPWCLFIYIVAFSLAAYLILLVAMFIKYLTVKFAKKTKEPTKYGAS